MCPKTKKKKKGWEEATKENVDVGDGREEEGEEPRTLQLNLHTMCFSVSLVVLFPGR